MQHIVWSELFPSVQLWNGCDDLKHEHEVLLSPSENSSGLQVDAKFRRH